MLFGRIAKATVGKSGGSGLEISGLRMTFSVKKTMTRTANTCDLEITNLSAEIGRAHV